MTDKNETIFSREGENATLSPDSSEPLAFKLPTDRSVLSVLGNTTNSNRLQDGDVFESDGWVHRDGKKHHKWFSYMDGWSHFWEPVLNDVNRLESVYNRLKVRQDKRYANLWTHVRLITETIDKSKSKWNQDVWAVSCDPTNPKHHSPTERWVYNIEPSSRDSSELSYSMDWISREVPPVRLDLGNRMYELEQITRGKMKRMLAMALDKAIIKHLRTKFPGIEQWKNDDQMFEVVVSGRRYIYAVMGQRGFGGGVQGCALESMRWPGDSYTMVEI